MRHYFAAGNERMLGSILGTMAPRVEIMRQAVRAAGAAFSVRNWIRAEGRGTLWLPYQAHQIAALRELISCWVGLAITEVLALPDSATRRIWFDLDEFDALGPLQGLKDAQARLRKKGSCVVIGVQSIDQVRAVYGAAAANTIIENCGNWLSTSAPVPSRARAFSRACARPRGWPDPAYAVTMHGATHLPGRRR
ncbi:MAG: type IV secretion system DNA-binding domain-containing protein [Acetobacteraceae bacterium]